MNNYINFFEHFLNQKNFYKIKKNDQKLIKKQNMGIKINEEYNYIYKN